MGLFDKFFDKREKIDYMNGSYHLFRAVFSYEDQYTASFDDINYVDYRAELIGIVAAYLDRDPKIKTFDSYRSFGECILYYGTVHAPSEIKEPLLPRCQKTHKYYRQFFCAGIGQIVSASAASKMARDIISRYKVNSDAAHINAITVDISKVIEKVDAILGTYRFVT